VSRNFYLTLANACLVEYLPFLDKTKRKALDFSRAFGFVRMVPDYQMVEVVGIEPTSEKSSI